MRSDADMCQTPPRLARPSVQEIRTFLRERSALIVHFSGAPKGAGKERGPGNLFPNDLRRVIDGGAQGGVCCSVVVPGDEFHGLHRNATGSIGVILDVTSGDSILGADPEDAGSFENENGDRQVRNPRDISIADLAATLEKRLAYNEWVMANYRVVGVFAVPPFDYAVNVPLKDLPEALRAGIDGEGFPDLRRTTLDGVSQLFSIPIYTFTKTGLARYVSGNLEPIRPECLYPFDPVV